MAILRRRSGKVRQRVPVRIAVAVMPAGIGELNRAGGVGLPPCSFAVSGREDGPRRVLNLSFLLNQNGPSSAGSLPLTDRFYNVTSLLHPISGPPGDISRFWSKCTSFL